MRKETGSVLTADELISLELHVAPEWQRDRDEEDSLPGGLPLNQVMPLLLQ
jgi:hypothetical protein